MEVLKDKLMELQKQKKTLEAALKENRQKFNIAMGGNTPIEKREVLQQEGKKYADALLAVTSEIKKLKNIFGHPSTKFNGKLPSVNSKPTPTRKNVQPIHLMLMS